MTTLRPCWYFLTNPGLATGYHYTPGLATVPSCKHSSHNYKLTSLGKCTLNVGYRKCTLTTSVNVVGLQSDCFILLQYNLTSAEADTYIVPEMVIDFTPVSFQDWEQDECCPVSFQDWEQGKCCPVSFQDWVQGKCCQVSVQDWEQDKCCPVSFQDWEQDEYCQVSFQD